MESAPFPLLFSNYSKYLFHVGQGENEGTDNFAWDILQRKTIEGMLHSK